MGILVAECDLCEAGRDLASLERQVGNHEVCGAKQRICESAWPQPGSPVDKGSGWNLVGGGGGRQKIWASCDPGPQWAILIRF